MILPDSHAHLPGVAEDSGGAVLEDLLADYAAAWAGPGPSRPWLVDIGTQAGDFPARLALSGRRPFLGYSLGIWPGLPALDDVPGSLAALKADLAAARAGEAFPGELVVAIGECGLDYHHLDGSPASQAALFEGQLDLAAREGLPTIIHTRDAFEATLGLIKGRGGRQALLIHCFGYGPREAEAFLAEGCLISFAGNVSYKKAEALREALALVPRGRLLLETDSPYMNPEPRRGRPASPRDIERTYALAAECLGLPLEALAAELSQTLASFLFSARQAQ